MIDPVHGLNVDRPYSPEKTCGKCHDYEKITSAYHFTVSYLARDPDGHQLPDSVAPPLERVYVHWSPQNSFSENRRLTPILSK